MRAVKMRVIASFFLVGVAYWSGFWIEEPSGDDKSVHNVDNGSEMSVRPSAPSSVPHRFAVNGKEIAVIRLVATSLVVKLNQVPSIRPSKIRTRHIHSPCKMHMRTRLSVRYVSSALFHYRVYQSH